MNLIDAILKKMEACSDSEYPDIQNPFSSSKENAEKFGRKNWAKIKRFTKEFRSEYYSSAKLNDHKYSQLLKLP